MKPKAPAEPVPCVTCGAPSIKRPAPKPHRCAACAAIERDIASQKVKVLVLEIRKLKAWYWEHIDGKAA